MHEHRRYARFNVDLPVTLSTVLDFASGSIVDLSEGGAQIEGAAFPKSTRVLIDWQGHTIFALVMWSEIDRMGVRFEFPLVSGPLHDLMTRRQLAAQARATFVPPMRHAPPFGRRLVS